MIGDRPEPSVSMADRGCRTILLRLRQISERRVGPPAGMPAFLP